MRGAEAALGPVGGESGARGEHPAPSAPAGLAALLEGLTREILKANPTDIYAFCAQHFEELLKIRDAHEGRKTKATMTLEKKIQYVQKKLREKAEKRHNKYIDFQSEINISHAETEGNDSEQKLNIAQTKTVSNIIQRQHEQFKSDSTDEDISQKHQIEDTIRNTVTEDGNMTENLNKMDQIHNEIQEKNEENSKENQIIIDKQETIENDNKGSLITPHNEQLPIEGKADLIPSLAESLTENRAVGEDILQADNPVKVNGSNDYVQIIVPENMVPQTVEIECLKETNEVAIRSIEGELVGQAPSDSTGKEDNIESIGDNDTNGISDSNHNESTLQITEVEVGQDNIVEKNQRNQSENDNSNVESAEIKENSSEMSNFNKFSNENVPIEDINEMNPEQTPNQIKNDNYSKPEEIMEITNENNQNKEIKQEDEIEPTIVKMELKESKEQLQDIVSDVAPSEVVTEQTQSQLINDNSEPKKFTETTKVSNQNIEMEPEELNDTETSIVKMILNESEELKLDCKDFVSTSPNEVVKEKQNIQIDTACNAIIGEDKLSGEEPYNAIPEPNIIIENKREKDGEDSSVLDTSKDFEEINVSEGNGNHVDKHVNKDKIDLKEKNMLQNLAAISTELHNITVKNDIEKHAPDIVDSGMLQDNVELLIAGNSDKNYESIDSVSQERKVEVLELNEMENATNVSDRPNFETSVEEQAIENKILDVNSDHKECNERKSSESNGNVVKPIVNSISMDLETAAITIQKVFRAFMFKSRASTSEENTNDGNSIEMSEPSNKTPDSEGEYLRKAIGDEVLGVEEKVPGALVRMNTVLQTVNEEKSLSLSTDESLSSAATVIQAHVRGFLVRNRLNSNKLRSSDTTAASDETFNMDTPRASSAKTVLNINIREQENFVSTGDSLDTSMDLPTDPAYVVNLHPLGYDKDARKRLIREDAIQSVSPPSNSSFNSPKEMSIEQTENKTLETNISQLDGSKEDIIKEDAGQNEGKITNEIEKTDSMEINATKLEESSALTSALINSDEMDVVTPFYNENSEPSQTVNDERPGLLHSSEFHDVVLPTRVIRNDSTVVRGE